MKVDNKEWFALTKSYASAMFFKAWPRIIQLFAIQWPEFKKHMMDVLDTIVTACLFVFAILCFILSPFFFWVAPVFAFITLKTRKPSPKNDADDWWDL